MWYPFKLIAINGLAFVNVLLWTQNMTNWTNVGGFKFSKKLLDWMKVGVGGGKWKSIFLTNSVVVRFVESVIRVIKCGRMMIN